MTAIEWLVQELKSKGNALITNKGVFINVPDDFVLQAKAMEKEQIVDANISGMEFIPVDPSMYKQDAEQYYNETFGS